MLYDIVLKNGQDVKCFVKDVNNVVEMTIKHDLYIVQENDHPDKVTYISKEDVSYIRLPREAKDVAKPVV